MTLIINARLNPESPDPSAESNTRLNVAWSCLGRSDSITKYYLEEVDHLNSSSRSPTLCLKNRTHSRTSVPTLDLGEQMVSIDCSSVTALRAGYASGW